MPKMSPGDLRALLAAEKADALSAMSASKLSEERSRALDYYLGDMSRDMPAPDGRSKAVSTDDADFDGDLLRRRRGRALRAGRPRGCGRGRAGDGLRQSRLHAAEPRISRPI